jgi:hypothetical protein
MSADFVPFLQSLNSRLVSGQPSSFAPVPESSVSAAASALCAGAHSPGSEVKVELNRDGDRITQIRIQCRCGELIELACDY